jgi:hypothetical protein
MFAMVKAASADAAAKLDDLGRYRDDGAEYRDHDDGERDSSCYHRYRVHTFVYTKLFLSRLARRKTKISH